MPKEVTHAPSGVLDQCYVFPLNADRKPIIKWRDGSRKGIASFPNHSGPWGIDCGKSGLVVIDVDNKNGKAPGLENWEKMGEFSDTFTVRTKSGGLHLYFSDQGAPVKNSVSALAQGIDIKSDGGFVVFYPDVVNDSPINELPESLRKKLNPAPTPNERGKNSLIDLDQPRNIAAAVEHARQAAPAIEGDGGDAHTLSVAMQIKDLGITPETALDILLDEWNENCEPPWEPEELRRKIASAYTYGRSAPGSATREHTLTESAQRAEQVFTDIPALVRARMALEIIPATQWGATTPPPSDPVLKGFFDVGDIACIIGAAKSYKTWFVLQMAVCIASGRSFLGIEAERPRKVLFIQFEVKADHFHRRFKTLLHGIGMKKAPDNLGFVNGRGLDVQMSQIVEAVKSWGAEVIFLDPLYILIAGDENNATDLKALLKQFAQIARDAGAAIVFTHHDAKGVAGDRKTADRGSGSGVLGRFYDAALTITDHRDQDALKVITPLLRNYKPIPPFCVTWDHAFTLSEESPDVLTSKSSNQKHSSRQPAESFIEDVRQCIASADALALNKGALIDSLRSSGLTRAHAENAIGAALNPFDEELRVFTNHGKGLPRKQCLYALSEEDLQTAMKELK